MLTMQGLATCFPGLGRDDFDLIPHDFPPAAPSPATQHSLCLGNWLPATLKHRQLAACVVAWRPSAPGPAPRAPGTGGPGALQEEFHLSGPLGSRSWCPERDRLCTCHELSHRPSVGSRTLCLLSRKSCHKQTHTESINRGRERREKGMAGCGLGSWPGAGHPGSPCRGRWQCGGWVATWQRL